MRSQGDFYYTFGNPADELLVNRKVHDPVTLTKAHVLGYGASAANATTFCILLENAVSLPIPGGFKK